MIAANQGAEEVIAIDLEDYRLEKSTEFGATATINADKENVVEAIAEATGGKGVDVVVDASGDADGLNQAVNLVNQRGLVIGFSLVETATNPTVFRHQEWMRKEVRVIPTGSAGSVDDALWFTRGSRRIHNEQGMIEREVSKFGYRFRPFPNLLKSIVPET